MQLLLQEEEVKTAKRKKSREKINKPFKKQTTMWEQITKTSIQKLKKNTLVAKQNPELDLSELCFIIDKIDSDDMGEDIHISTYLNTTDIGLGTDSISGKRITNESIMLKENWFVNFKLNNSK